MSKLHPKSQLHRQIQAIGRDLGLLLHIPGIMAIASLPIGWAFGEENAIAPFLLTAIASQVGCDRTRVNGYWNRRI